MAYSVHPHEDTQFVYALGTIDYDFGTDVQQEAMTNFLREQMQDEGKDPSNPQDLLEHLETHPYEAEGVNWTLNQDSIPIYVLHPTYAHATLVYERIRQLLKDQLNGEMQVASIAGAISGETNLKTGQAVPVIDPVMRGISSWTVASLVEHQLGKPPEDPEELANYERKQAEIQNFIERVYFEIRNLGQTPQERAINFATTTAYRLGQVFEDALKQDLVLDRIESEQSALCKPGADCWDVKLTFFNPTRRLEQARKEYRITVDVNGWVPVVVGKIRSWFAY
ncbi:hypothetical protein KFU94_70635 [Chloroflexi bacterium TSY]|nr:hypothetical protein [Chloroflexi bacterium TSY]